MKSIFLCAVAILSLGCKENMGEIQELKKQNAELRQKLEGLEIQEKCAKLAEHSFNSMQKERGAIYDYTCHYNKKQNKFLISVTITYPRTQMTAKFISDLLENRTIAFYMWHPDKVKQYWEVKPFVCDIYGEHKDWTSDEYNAFEKTCMSE